MAGDRKYCAGCREDYYNQTGGFGGKGCWSLPNADVVVRLRLGWWTQPTSRSCFTTVTTNSCHRAPGKYALMERYPDHLGGDRPARPTHAPAAGESRDG
jgi:hypothetical protein